MNRLSRNCIFFLLLFTSSGFFTHHSPTLQGFNKAIYYKLMEAGDLNGINKQLTIIVSNSDIEKLAYEGALMMKKAGMVKSPSQKLNLFKEGHKKLEAAIAENNDNAEWHFLRLIIQEHAPAIVNYHNHIKDDAQIVKDAFNTFSPEVQAAVSSYRKHSVALQALKF